MSETNTQQTMTEKQDKVSGALALLAQALNALKELGILPKDTQEVPAVESGPVAVTLKVPDTAGDAATRDVGVPLADAPIGREAVAPAAAKRPTPERGPGGRFLPPGVTADMVPALVRAPKAEKPVLPPKPLHKFPAPDLVDDFIKWFFTTPQVDLYNCKCGQYSVVVGNKEAKIASTLVFTTRARYGYTDEKKGQVAGEFVKPQHANNVIGIRPMDTDIGVFNASRILYGGSSAEQLRPQIAAEAAGAVPVPFENVVSKSGGAGLDLTKLEIVSWGGAEDMTIPPVKRNRHWKGDFFVISRHFAGAMVLRVEDKYFLFDADREELAHAGFNPFFTQLPRPALTVEDAYASLVPEEVIKARAEGRDVKRQGEFFFIKQTDTEVLDVATNTTDDVMVARKFKRMTEDFADVAGAHYIWIVTSLVNQIREFMDRCVKHNGGYLPAATTSREIKEDSNDFERSTVLAEPQLNPVISRYYSDWNEIPRSALGIRDGKNAIERAEARYDKSAFKAQLKNWGDQEAILSAPGFKEVAQELASECAAEVITWQDKDKDLRPRGELAKKFNVFWRVKLGKDGDTATQNAHVATGTLLSRKTGDIYAIGVVTHSGREHRPLYLPAWYKVVSNTATASWTVSGDVD